MRNFKILFKAATAVLFVSMLFVSCAEAEINPQEEEVQEELTTDPYIDRYGEEIFGWPFEIDFQLIQSRNCITKLEVNLAILEGSFVLSNQSGDEFVGRFLVNIPSNEFVLLDGAPTESPAPVEEIYYWADNEKVKKLKGEVNCQQGLIILSQEDFEVSGFVSFVVEPNCNLYETDFSISQKDGVLSVKKVAIRKATPSN